MNKLSSIADNKIKKKKLNGYYRKKTYDSKKTYDNKNLFNCDDDIAGIDTKIKKYPSLIKKNLFLDNSVNKNPFGSKNEFKLKKIKTFNIPVILHTNSITTNTSFGEKPMKKVTFSTVEIIRVEKYKKYNALCNFSKNQIKKNMDEVKQNENESSNCFIF